MLGIDDAQTYDEDKTLTVFSFERTEDLGQSLADA